LGLPIRLNSPRLSKTKNGERMALQSQHSLLSGTNRLSSVVHGNYRSIVIVLASVIGGVMVFLLGFTEGVWTTSVAVMGLYLACISLALTVQSSQTVSWLFMLATLCIVPLAKYHIGVLEGTLLLLLLPYVAAITLDSWRAFVVYILAGIAVTSLGCVVSSLELCQLPATGIVWINTMFCVNASLAFAHRRTYHAALRLLDERADLLQFQMTKLLQQERLVALGRMAGAISHQINNPLQVVIFALDTYIAEQGEKVDAFVSLAREHLELVRSIIDSLAALIKPSNIQCAVIDVNEAIAQSISLFQSHMASSGVTLQVTVRPDCPRVSMAPSDAVQILNVLVDNAIDALDVVDKPEKRLSISAIPNGLSVVISVTDNGCGIPEAIREYLFDPFVTTKGEDGTGLGLFLVYNIVDRAGGSVTCHTENGIGTTITVTLPIARAVPAHL
jgi:signal transduction histidine kinase